MDVWCKLAALPQNLDLRRVGSDGRDNHLLNEYTHILCAGVGQAWWFGVNKHVCMSNLTGWTRKQVNE